MVPLDRKFFFAFLWIGSLNGINDPAVDEFVNQIATSLLNLGEELCNLSHVLPKLLVWGPPPWQLAIERIPYKSLGKYEQ